MLPLKQIFIWWSHNRSIPWDMPETSCIIQGSELHGFWQKRILLKTFTTSWFSYCRLVWICHRRGLNNRIKTLRESVITIAYQDKNSNFEIWRKNDKSSTIYVNLRIYLYVIEIYKVKNKSLKIILHIVWETFFTFEKIETTTSAVVPILLQKTWE